MESGQRQPESPYTLEEDDCRRIYRDVIIQALRDLGSDNSLERSSVIRWIPSDEFQNCCILAQWEDSWLRDVFKSLALIDDSVRKQVSTQCVHALKFLNKMNEESGYFVTSHVLGNDGPSDENSGEYRFKANELSAVENISREHRIKYTTKYHFKRNK